MIPDENGACGQSSTSWREILWATLLFTAVVVVFAYPISLHPRTLRFPTGPDGDLGIYLLGWNSHAFLHRPWSIFDANIYYPERFTLAYGENVIGLGFFAAPVVWLTGDLMLATNFVLLLSCVLCGLGAYVLARRLGVGVTAAVLCGLIFEASPPRFFRVGQMNLSAVYCIPFGLAALHAYLDGGRPRYLRLAIAIFTLQVLTSGHGAVFMVVTLAGFLAYRLILGEPIRLLQRVRDVGVSGVLLLLPSILVFLPYRLVQREVGLRRGLGSWGVTFESWFASPSHVHQYLLHALGADQVNRLANAFLFPGYIPLLLSAVAAGWPLWRAARAIAARLRGRRKTAPSAAAALADGVSVASRQTAVRGDASHLSVIPNEAGREHVPHRSIFWTAAAICLEGLSAPALAVAVWLTATGPVKFRVGKEVVFSARGPLRAWLLFLGLVAARFLLRRLVPFDAGGAGRAVAIAASIARTAVRGVASAGRGVVRLQWVRPVMAWADRRRTDPTTLYAFLTLMAWSLAIGPPYGLWQYVYDLPGFSFIRASSRFTLVVLMGLGVLSAIGFERLTSKLSSARRLAFGGVVAALLLAEFAAMPMQSRPNNVVIPAIDRWLDTRPKPFVVAEVPTPRTAHREVFERQQSAYMLHSTAHWQKTVHGYSGWRTGEHELLYQQLTDFPDEKTLQALCSFDVNYVVVHVDAYPPGEWPAVEERIRAYYPRLRLEHVEGQGRVYSLTRQAGTAPAR